MRQILGAVSQFEKAALVAKLRGARDRKREATGRCGAPGLPADVVTAARKLAVDRPRLASAAACEPSRPS